jgi:hypothetical protein
VRERLGKAEGASAAEGEEDPEQVFRLTDITTREVSLVDRGANGHKFLLVKRSDEMGKKGQKVVTGKDGELETEGDATETAPEELSLTKAAKESLQAGVKKAIEGLTALQARLEKAAEVEEGEVPEEVGKAITDAATALVDAFPGEETGGIDVEKVGRKMSAARLKRLQAAFKTISDLVKELGGGEPEPEGGAKDDAKKTADENAQSVQDAITGAVAKALEDGLGPVVETLKAVQDGVSANARKVEEIAKTPGGSRQPANADDAPKPKATETKKGGFSGGDLNAGEVPKDRSFD